MIDLRAARNDPEGFRAALARKGAGELFDQLLEADRAVRDVQPRVEALRAEQNAFSKSLRGKPSQEDLNRLAVLKEGLREVEDQLRQLEARRQELLDRIPNPPSEETPDGETEEDAVEIRRVGDPPSFDFPTRDHLELAAVYGWPMIDTERGAKVSGSKFVYRLGDIALLELALYRFALDRLVQRGFTPVLPPVLVREEAMYGTGFLPTDEANIYAVERERDNLYLVGTSEVPLAAMRADEILDGDELPLRYAGYSTCFRREAGAAGRESWGMFRVHQFDKVEMFVFCLPENSRDEHERLLEIEEELVQEINLPYRVVNVAAGDLGASAAKKYDIEAWFPGQKRYREITSTSNTTDYQARRLRIRMRREQGTEEVHTLNGTAVTARAMLAIMENFQESDGSVSVPDVLTELGAPRKLGSERAPA
jgi:seryl-tRNA synthetase